MTSSSRANFWLVVLLVVIALANASVITEKLFRATNQDQVIDGSYIVVLNQTAIQSSIEQNSDNGGGSAASIIDRLLTLAPQGSVLLDRVYNRSPTYFNGFSIKVNVNEENDQQAGAGLGGMDAASIAARRKDRQELVLRPLLEDSTVQFIEQDQLVTTDTTQQNVDWGIDRIDQRNLPLNGVYTYLYDGSGVYVYVLDSGIRSTHNDFGGRVKCAYNTIGYENCDDGNGHGTHVAATIGGRTYGVAKNVNLRTVKVLDSSGSGSLSGVIDGIDFLANAAASVNNNGNRRTVVGNLSLGSSYSNAANSAVNAAVQSGAFVSVAAGNSNANACNYSPSAATNVMSVGATDDTDTRAYYSNYGSCVDIFAPGSSITSAWNTGDNSRNTLSGTSMASPHVAGLAALLVQQDPSRTPGQVKNWIISHASSGKLANVNGSPNLLLATQDIGGVHSSGASLAGASLGSSAQEEARSQPLGSSSTEGEKATTQIESLAESESSAIALFSFIQKAFVVATCFLGTMAAL